MSVYDLLTEEDKEKIIKYIDCYAPLTDSSSIPSINALPDILAEWDKEKSKNLLSLFGGQQLIISRPYTYSTTDDAIVREIEDVLENENCDIYYNFKQWIRNTLCSTEKGYPMAAVPFGYELFDSHCLAVNAYEGESKKIMFSDGTFWKIQKGMKPMKILAKIVERDGDDYAKQMYEEFRVWHSMLLNQIRLDGVLSLSIHPLDFMTMSDNGGSWTSCMRWMGEGSDEGEAGDYRAGTVECMNSPYIIVAYLHNPKKTFNFWEDWYNHNAFSWNKKKWRELFIVQNGVITEIKGYPYQDENLTNTVLMWVKELAHTNLGWEYDDIEVNMRDEYIEKDSDTVNLFRFACNNYMYNDFGTLNIHRGRVNLRDLHKRTDISISEYIPRGRTNRQVIFNLTYGGKTTCMCCGSQIGYIENRSNSVLCPDCEPTQICPCCGEYFDGEGYTVSSYGDPICYSCYEYECDRDDLSDDREYHGALATIYFCLGEDKDGNLVFHDNTIQTLDPDEYNNYSYQQLFNSRPKVHEGRYGLYKLYVTYDMIKDYDWFEDVFDIDETYEELLINYGLLDDPNQVEQDAS